MSLQWAPLWKKVFSTRIIPIAIRQNFRLLELIGEPVYLLVRMHKTDITRQNEPKEVQINSSELIDENDFCYLTLWRKGDDEQTYPDTRDLIVLKDNSELNNVFIFEYLDNTSKFLIQVIRDNAELNIEHEIRVYFSKGIKAENKTLLFRFFTILPAFSDVYMQSEARASQISLYGWRQALWRGTYYRDKFIRGALLVAFPDLQRDLTLESTGFVVSSDYDLWTSPPPLSPIINEHDVIVRLNGLRYEIRNLTRNIVQNMLVQQEFKVSEIEPSSPIYDIKVDTVRGELVGFPKDVYTGR